MNIHISLATAASCFALLLISGVQGATVALWPFDEAVDSPRGSSLKDTSGHGFDLELGEAHIVANGQFGHALECPQNPADFVARRLQVQGQPLNLGNFDWTIEWWQRRSGPVPKGFVDWAFEICDENID